MKLYRIGLIFALVFSIQPIFAQYTVRYTTNDDVRLFQTFFEDAALTDVTYGEGFFNFSDYDFFSSVNLGVQGGIPLSDNFELGLGWGFLSINPENGDGRSGLDNVSVFGKQHMASGRTQISAGGFITLPIGSDNVGGDNFDFGGFAALRHPFSPGLTVTGNAGLVFRDAGGHDASLRIGGGVIYQTSPQMNIIGELNLETQGDVGLLSGGIDYVTGGNGHIRSVLGLGIDNGAPDILIQFSYLVFFSR